jgi:glycosyltransferase involved in cell wall biosynthesis
VRTVRIPRRISPAADARALWRLWRLFRGRRVDVVHTHTPKAALLGQLAARLAGVPVRFNTIHGLFFVGQRSRAARRLYKELEVLACRLATDVLSQSREDVDLLLAEKLLPPAKLRWLGNGVDLSRFDPARFSPADRAAVRRELRIPDDAFVVGCVARMVREKGLTELFQAVARLRGRLPRLHLVHVGFVDRSRNDQLTPDDARRLGIADRCRFLGHRRDVARLLAAVDAYALPSYREGYPRSVMEACAMGLPVVVTDIRGSREAVVHGASGLVVPPRDAAALSSALERLHEDASLRGRLSAGARARALEAFDERRVFGVLLESYAAALGRAWLAEGRRPAAARRRLRGAAGDGAQQRRFHAADVGLGEPCGERQGDGAGGEMLGEGEVALSRAEQLGDERLRVDGDEVVAAPDAAGA